MNEVQSQNNYYYIPYAQGGQYQNTFEQFGNDVGRPLIALGAFAASGGLGDPAQASNTGMGKLGDIVVSILGDIGRGIDNRNSILSDSVQNMETALQQLNDARMWMSPDLSD
jgi:hypothetical protein